MIAHELHILLWLKVHIPLWLMGINMYKTRKISLILLVLCEPAIPGSSGRPSHLGTLAIRENPWRASLCTYIWGFHQWGQPIAGWFISWTILLKWMILGYPYFRNPQVLDKPEVPCLDHMCGWSATSSNIAFRSFSGWAQQEDFWGELHDRKGGWQFIIQ